MYDQLVFSLDENSTYFKTDAKISKKISILPKNSRTLYDKKKLHKRIPDETESTSTRIDHPKISQSLNDYNLKLSLRSLYSCSPEAQLKKIFKKKHSVSIKSHLKHNIKHTSCEIPSRKRSQVDSIFQKKEAELIMSELKTINSPELWSRVVSNFKQRPSALMDLIPIK